MRTITGRPKPRRAGFASCFQTAWGAPARSGRRGSQGATGGQKGQAYEILNSPLQVQDL